MKAQGMACSQAKMYTLHVVVWRLNMKSLLTSSADVLSSHQNRVAFASTVEASYEQLNQASHDPERHCRQKN